MRRKQLLNRSTSSWKKNWKRQKNSCSTTSEKRLKMSRKKRAKYPRRDREKCNQSGQFVSSPTGSRVGSRWSPQPVFDKLCLPLNYCVFSILNFLLRVVDEWIHKRIKSRSMVIGSYPDDHVRIPYILLALSPVIQLLDLNHLRELSSFVTCFA